MDLEQENKELQRYIRELKQQLKEVTDQLSFERSKSQQITPDNPNQYRFPFWHEDPFRSETGTPVITNPPSTSTRTIEDDIYDTYYKPLDNREIGGETGY